MLSSSLYAWPPGMRGTGSMVELTQEEIKIIRKALQIILMAHDVIETNDGTDFRDTKVQELLRRFREEEDRG